MLTVNTIKMSLKRKDEDNFDEYEDIDWLFEDYTDEYETDDSSIEEKFISGIKYISPFCFFNFKLR